MQHYGLIADTDEFGDFYYYVRLYTGHQISPCFSSKGEAEHWFLGELDNHVYEGPERRDSSTVNVSKPQRLSRRFDDIYRNAR